MDVVGGDHGVLALGAGAVFDPAKDSPLALPEFVEDIGFHSRVSVVWPNEDMRLPPLLPNYRGFSSFPRQMSLQDLYITLGSGLEWYLLIQNLWRVVMSTDHPNGGSFLAYPQIIRLLMDRSYRQDLLRTLHRNVRENSVLA